MHRLAESEREIFSRRCCFCGTVAWPWRCLGDAARAARRRGKMARTWLGWRLPAARKRPASRSEIAGQAQVRLLGPARAGVGQTLAFGDGAAPVAHAAGMVLAVELEVAPVRQLAVGQRGDEFGRGR